jgi:hypothetical protein
LQALNSNKKELLIQTLSGQIFPGRQRIVGDDRPQVLHFSLDNSTL